MDIPDLDDLKAWLGVSNAVDDDVFEASLSAALAAQANTVDYPVDELGEVVMTDDLVEAVFLRAQRLAARRNSPEGVVGLSGIGGEFVGARLTSTDPDVTRLEGPYLKVVVA